MVNEDPDQSGHAHSLVCPLSNIELLYTQKHFDVAQRNINTKTRLFKYIEILQPKKENFQMKKSDIFHISAQHIDCGTR